MKNQIQATIVADSVSKRGDRITTMMVTFPRYILAEFNTHRMFSRNSASSRAIPFKKMVESIRTNPFIPIAWQKDHTGMQGTEYVTDQGEINSLEARWVVASIKAIESAEDLNTFQFFEDEAVTSVGITKQICNRLLEPYMWHTVLVTATDWENFFALRCPQYQDIYTKDKFYRSWKDYLKHIEDTQTFEYASNLDTVGRLKENKGQSEIHMMALAEAMWDAYNESTPKELKDSEWHIPFGDNFSTQEIVNLSYLEIEEEVSSFFNEKLVSHNYEYLGIKALIKIATARCARVSYTVVGEEDKVHDYKKDLELHDRLLKSGHFSPFEHCAQVMTDEEYFGYTQEESEPSGFRGPFEGRRFDHYCRNFKGFKQYRSMID